MNLLKMTITAKMKPIQIYTRNTNKPTPKGQK